MTPPAPNAAAILTEPRRCLTCGQPTGRAIRRYCGRCACYRHDAPEPDHEEAPPMTTRYRQPGRTAGTYYLPGETDSEVLADFVAYYDDLRRRGKSGGGDYGGARASEIVHALDIILKRLQHMGWGAGDDVLFLAADQAEHCRQCIARGTGDDAQGRPLAQLARGAGLDKSAGRR